MRKAYVLVGAVAIAGSLLLSGCGADTSSSGSTGVSEGVFVDSAVEGVKYQTTTQNGYTNATGTFKYKAGEKVSFYLGSQKLGEAYGDAKLYPTDVAGDSNLSSTKVKNMLVLLQSLDNDGNTSNGISIHTALRDHNFSYEFNLSATNFMTNTLSEINAIADKNFSYSAISETTALAHFADTKRKIYFGSDLNLTGTTVMALVYRNTTATICNSLQTSANLVKNNYPNLKYQLLSSSATCNDLGFITTGCIESDYRTTASSGTQTCAYIYSN
ncbi:MAG: hypothetical protein KU37_07335 [Sulfuricurvum sp. PC08-66]|nr:MAG: hypothetical protein KU37_07335 [Sulfuricurvum sp. PC08-66]